MRSVFRFLLAGLFAGAALAHGAGGAKEESAEHEEANSAIGPDKGILEAGEQGFKLSPEAIATFGVKFETIAKNAPESSIAKVKDRKYLYRRKDGWIKRIELPELNAGDEIAVSGVGYIRIAELVVVEGLADD